MLKNRRITDNISHKLGIAAIWLIGTLVIVAAVILGIFALPDHKTLVYFNQPFPTDKTEYKIGDTIKFSIQYHRYAKIPNTFSRQLVCKNSNGVIQFFVLDSATTLNLGPTPNNIAYQTAEVTTGVIPKNAPFNEPCYVYTNSTYIFNFLTIKTIGAVTTDFTIVQ